MTTVAIAQVAPRFLDLDGSVAVATDAIAEAASAGAGLVAFSETWLPGYPVWADAGIAWEDPATKDAFARLQRNAIEIPGRALDRLSAAARRHRINVAIGASERDTRSSRGSLYNTLLYLSDSGDLLGYHRKLVPTHSERIIWGQGDGSSLCVTDTSVGRLGGLICWEHWMPLARFAMHAKAEQIHVAAWPDTPEMHQLASRSYAFEGRCFVMFAGQYLPLSAVPEDLMVRERIVDMADADGVVMPGGSGVIGPDGNWITVPVDGEAMIYAELDLAVIAEEHQVLDSTGHYNRPDVFRLVVDESPREAVTWTSSSVESDATQAHRQWAEPLDRA